MYKLIKYDIKQGIMYNKVKFLVLIILVIAFCIAFRVDAAKFTGLYRFNFGDYLLYIVEGARQLKLDELKEFKIPIMWLGIQVVIGYIVGYYATDDLHTYGQQILIRSGSRSRWWISKCIWNILMVLLAYMTIYGVTAIFCVIMGENMNRDITRQCIENQMFKTTSVNTTQTNMVIMLFIMPALVSLTISMVQMVVSLIVSPIVGFIVGQVVLFGSTLFPYKFFIGNYSMFAKSEICGMTDINVNEGIGICVGIFVSSFVIGIVYFNRCNILAKE